MDLNLPGEDPRMRLTVGEPKSEEHVYLVEVRPTPDLPYRGRLFKGGTEARHKALRAYISLRKALKDFSNDPGKFLVRISCDDVEYFNNQDHSMRGYITGSNRPVATDRQLP